MPKKVLVFGCWVGGIRSEISEIQMGEFCGAMCEINSRQHAWVHMCRNPKCCQLITYNTVDPVRPTIACVLCKQNQR